MGCLKTSELWKETDKVYKKWSSSKTLERWGFTNDREVFKKLFEANTDKVLLAGENIEPKDMRKMYIAIEKLEHDLRSPGVLSNKVLKNIYVGSAMSMRNPITKDFFETLTNANEFRNSNSSSMMTSYNSLIRSLKVAILEFDGLDSESLKSYGPKRVEAELLANMRFNALNDTEKDIVSVMKNNESTGTGNEWGVLKKFLNNEGSVFEDFKNRVEEGSDAGLKHKYRANIENRKAYINRINKAASQWSEIQSRSKTNLVQSINNLSEIIKFKYGEESKTAEFLINEYKDVADKLDKSEGNYIPHYVLDLLGQSIEIGERMSKSTSDKQRDSILREYVNATKDINANLLQRLREKSDQPSEYFSRNPMLYAAKYIEQVIQFNHNSYVDLAYIKGLKKITETAFRNEGTKEAKAAGVYKDILKDLYNANMNKDSGLDAGSNASNITRLLTSMQFISKLGWSTRGAIRNGTQRILNFAYLGPKMQIEAYKSMKSDEAYAEAMNKELLHHGLKFQDISAVTEGAVTASDLLARGIDYEKGILTFKDRESILEKATKATTWTAGKSAVMTKFFENQNRKSTFKVAFHKRVEQLKNTDRYSNFFQDSKVKDEMYRSAGNYASKITSLLHFEYAPHGKSKIFRSGAGAVMGQFQHYALSFANLQTQMVKDYGRALKAGDWKGEELGRLMRLGSIYAMAELVSGYFDINFTTYINNDTLDRAKELVTFLTSDEEESKEAFYGK